MPRQGPTPSSSAARSSEGATRTASSRSTPRTPTTAAASTPGGERPRPTVTPTSNTPTSKHRPRTHRPAHTRTVRLGHLTDNGTLTVRLAGFDPATGQLRYVTQHLVQASGHSPTWTTIPPIPPNTGRCSRPTRRSDSSTRPARTATEIRSRAGLSARGPTSPRRSAPNLSPTSTSCNGSVTAVRQVYQA